MRSVLGIFILLAASVASAQPLYSTAIYSAPSWVNTIPAELRQTYRNYDGSCVQCALGIVGQYHDNPNMAMLLWTSEFGPAERGGSDPGRVHEYCQRRGIPVYNVSGRSSFPWVEWALKNGRNCGVTWGSNHMITAVGISPDGQQIAVVDNNSPGQVDIYSRQQFIANHTSYRGGWCVIPAGPVPTPWDAPGYHPWWR